MGSCLQRTNSNVNVNVSFLTHSGFWKASFPTYTLLLQRNMKVSLLTLSSLVVKCMVAAYWPKGWRSNPGRVNQNKPCQYSRVVTARASCWSTIIHMNRHVCQIWLTDDTIHMSNLSLSLTLSRFSKNVFGIQRLINAIGYQYIWYIWLPSEVKLECKCECVFPDTFRIFKS